MGCNSLAFVILKSCLGLKEGRGYNFYCFLLAPKGAIFTTMRSGAKCSLDATESVHTVLNMTSAAASLSSLRLGKGPTACATSPVICGIFSFECGSAADSCQPSMSLFVRIYCNA